MRTDTTPETDTIVVIGCTAEKADHPTTAADMYRGRTFGLTLSAALAEVDNDADRVLILSAGYGLIRLTDVVAPYDATIDQADTALVTRQAEALGLADRTDVYAMLPHRYFRVLREALDPIGTTPTRVFEDDRGIGDQRHVLSHSIATAGIDRQEEGAR